MKLSTWMFVLLVVLVGAVMVSGCGPADQIKGNTHFARFYNDEGKLVAEYGRNGSDDSLAGFTFEGGADRKLEIKKSTSTDQVAGWQAQGYQQWQQSQQFSMAILGEVIGAALGKDVSVPAIGGTGTMTNMYRTRSDSKGDSTNLSLLTSEGLTDEERLVLLKALTKSGKKEKSATTQPAGQ